MIDPVTANGTVPSLRPLGLSDSLKQPVVEDMMYRLGPYSPPSRQPTLHVRDSGTVSMSREEPCRGSDSRGEDGAKGAICS